MALGNAYAAAASRPLPLRMRADLEFVPLHADGATRFAVKDAVTLRYWRLEAEEVFLLRLLDGGASLAEICNRFAREFAPRRLTTQQLNAYLANLYRERVVVADQPGQAEAILERRRQEGKLGMLRALGHLLAWRFRGIDPDRWLARLTPRLCFLFTAWSAALFVFLLATALLMMVLNWPALDRDLAGLAGSFTADDALLIMMAIGAAKALHELGHAVTCKHFGGECHELGFMLFVGAPSLYCNVSDVWMFKRKMPRIMTSAAGILVELALAAACAWLWRVTYPGAIHSLALYTSVVCSLNTLLLNGNPLLPFDGYYVLADLSDTPNLRAEAGAALRRLSARVLLGLRIEPDAWLRGRRQAWLMLYAIASTIYRFAVVIGVVWFLHDALEPYDMQLIGWIIGAMLLLIWLIEPGMHFVRFFRRPSWDHDVPWRWATPRAAIAVAVCCGILVVPLPRRVVAPVLLEPHAARSIYVEVEGRLVWAIMPGARVAVGDVIAKLENLPLATELARLTGQRDTSRQRLQTLQRRQADPEAAAQIPTVEKSLADAAQRLQQRERDFERLVIRAPRSGIVLPPARRTIEKRTMPAWIGTPLDEQNRGCYLKTGDEICVIGEPQAMDAILFVVQGDEDLIQAGQPVEVLLDSFPARQITGAIAIPPSARASDVPDELLGRGALHAEKDAAGNVRSREALYAARAELGALDEPILTAAAGRAKVSVAPQSLAGRIWRSIRQTFRGS